MCRAVCKDNSSSRGSHPPFVQVYCVAQRENVVRVIIATSPYAAHAHNDIDMRFSLFKICQIKSRISRGKYCCAYGCLNTASDTNGKSTGIHFFTFPIKVQPGTTDVVGYVDKMDVMVSK